MPRCRRCCHESDSSASSADEADRAKQRRQLQKSATAKKSRQAADEEWDVPQLTGAVRSVRPTTKKVTFSSESIAPAIRWESMGADPYPGAGLVTTMTSIKPGSLASTGQEGLPPPVVPTVSIHSLSTPVVSPVNIQSLSTSTTVPPGIPQTSLAVEATDGTEEEMQNGCGREYSFQAAEERGALRTDDEIHEYYKRDDWWAGLAGMVSDVRKTMYCHHFTSEARGGFFAVRQAKLSNLHFKSTEEVWKFLGKEPCCGKFHRAWGEQDFTCVECTDGAEDRTCTAETCLFVANYLPCPVPESALAD
mmetsp:Transcript_93757/g.166812  ORF Transcript_93757/g.166812 Transcript_93757/m.166812 type:complete len:306 (+) Transcript_93757:82-999(+)